MSDPKRDAAIRAINASLRPVNDRILADLGLTRAEVFADPSCVRRAAERLRAAQAAPPTPIDATPTGQVELAASRKTVA